MTILYRNRMYYECEASEKDELLSLYGWSDHQTNKHLIGHELKKCPNPFRDRIKQPSNKETVKLDVTKLSWNDLRSYGKELEKQYKVNLPLGSKREEIENAINKLLEG